MPKHLHYCPRYNGQHTGPVPAATVWPSHTRGQHTCACPVPAPCAAHCRTCRGVLPLPPATPPQVRARRVLACLRGYGVPLGKAVPLANACAHPHALPAPGASALAQAVPMLPRQYRGGYALRMVQALANGCAPATARYL